MGRHVAVRPGREVRRSASSITALGLAGGLFVATSFPAFAVVVAAEVPTAAVYEQGEAEPAAQPGIHVSAAAEHQPLTSDGYVAEAPAPPPVVAYVTGYGYVEIPQDETAATVVWPVQNPESRSDGFGPREAPCDGCSTFHDGVDFVPGEGSTVVSVADGVVVAAVESDSGLGVHVEVEHHVDGQQVTSSYAHMQFGSLAVSVGEQVVAGQQLGLVGSTGQSTGAHLHLEMFGADGARFDGFDWLAAHVR